MKKVQYEKRKGFRIKGDAEKIGRRLNKLEKSDGSLTPALIVKDARNPKSPLHNEFEWDDSKAAQQYRLEQARYITRAIECTIIEHEQEIKTYPYVSLRDEPETPYYSTTTILQSEDKTDRWIAQAKHDLKIWRNKYSAIKELKGLFEVIDEVL